MAQKPGIPKGTRDFSPTEVAKRDYIFAIIKKHFELFGFQPIETPSFENSSTLLGKYGEEGDRLIFKILNSGDFLAKADENFLKDKNSSKVTAQISEKALRYDLTVPFARYVVQHQNELVFPFKRYQMQPVWRADRPQKGRFREFYQCDADVIGSKSLLQEVEFIQLYDAIFSELGVTATIKLNNRKILSGIAEIIGAKDKLINFTVALDKLDKIGEEGVVNEMLTKGISQEAIAKVKPLFELSGTSEEKLDTLKGLLASSDEGLQGVQDLRFVIESISKLGLDQSKLELDVTLARGLNYYTGAIFEVVANDVKLGSIGGGGRYDDLTGIFGLKDMSGIGISFGLDRIYLVLEELGLFKQVVELPKPKVLFLNFGEAEANYCLEALKAFRESDIKAEIYPDAFKIKKQLNYANKREIEFVVLVGEEELQRKRYTLKQMNSGEQQTLDLEELLQAVRNS
ncbi:MAG: histidine--tRNA ligase [Flavobacteriaceae bacterium]|nr:histidine--tRNA ligase [Flavobacteriaceae bacterium]